MHYVVAKLTALDPDAGAAMEVIARFDELVESGAGLAPILTAAAVTTRCAIRMIVPEHGVHLHVSADGTVADARSLPAPDPSWLTAPLVTGGKPVLWLERSAHGLSLVDAMVLERTAFAARSHFERTEPTVDRGAEKSAAIRLLLDPGSSVAQRHDAASTLGLARTVPVRAVAIAGADPKIEHAPKRSAGDGQLRADAPRTGIGPLVGLDDSPESWRQAKLALAFAAEGSDRDPGETVIHADDLGVLGTIISQTDFSGIHLPDVDALDRVSTTAPWALRTIDAFVSHASIRLAAASLFVHHSSFQQRIAGLERQLKWDIREPNGRFRLHLALATRRYLLHPIQP